MGRPMMTATVRPMMPITVASPILPGRILYMYRLMKSASGIVAAIVKRPHGLLLSALTNGTPTPASAMTMMKRIAMAAISPASGLISWRAIVASDAPFRRVDPHSEIMSCTAPARQTPATSQSKSGHEAELRRQHRPDERARTGDRREVVAEQHPPRRHVIVVAVSLRVRRRDVPVVERHHLGREERAVVAVGQDQGTPGPAKRCTPLAWPGF